MNKKRVRSILSNFRKLNILIVGDFFLDKYLIIDPALKEISLETDLEVYQVIEKRLSPGAAGTVTSNLRALGIDKVYAIGLVGRDGEGFDLRKRLASTGVETNHLIESPSQFTPTYTKPMMKDAEGKLRELNRIDIKNRQPTPRRIETRILENIQRLLPHVEGVILADQVQEANCGVLTDSVRTGICKLAEEQPQKRFIADSRTRLGIFSNVMLKPNESEAIRAIFPEWNGIPNRSLAQKAGRSLYEKNKQPVFVTAGAKGIYVHDQRGSQLIPGRRVRGEIDIVGAGDSALAALTATLCCGGTPEEAAMIGNAAASITIQQIGTTGTATVEQILDCFR